MIISSGQRRDIRDRWIPRKGFKGPSEEEAVRILGALMNGCTMRTAAQYAGLHTTLIRNWRKKDKDFDEACGDAAAYANRMVEQSLFKMATVPDNYGKTSTSAAIFWLKNRAQEEWRTVDVEEKDGDKMLVLRWKGDGEKKTNPFQKPFQKKEPRDMFSVDVDDPNNNGTSVELGEGEDVEASDPSHRN